ncbi:hypothetical protein G7054_g9668 [Neopestalotiopsis clavispora]|nr:hypothetical protein G7054_g9668 [Neopestalotiopsis clavispora]
MTSEALVTHGDASTCWFLSRVPAVIDIDQRGDRVLHIGTNKCEIDDDDDDNHQHTAAMSFRVSSHVLSQLSPVFRAMFFGRFREADQEIVELPDDDPEAMETLLHIAHLQFGPACDIIGRHTATDDNYRLVDDVYGLVVVANKYLAIDQLRPWVSGWTSVLLPFVTSIWTGGFNYQQKEKLEQLLFIASELGHFQIYEEAFIKLVGWHRPDMELFSTILEPSGTKDKLVQGRWLLIEQNLNAMKEIMELLMIDHEGSSKYQCSATKQATRTNCRLHTMGVLLNHLKKKSIFPLPEADDMDECADGFHNRVTLDVWSHRGLHCDCATRAALSSTLQEAHILPWYIGRPTPLLMQTMSARAESFGFPQCNEEPEVNSCQEPDSPGQDPDSDYWRGPSAWLNDGVDSLGGFSWGSTQNAGSNAPW